MKDEEEKEESFEEIEEDSELINYLNEDTIDYDTLGIDDEFIYHPGDEDTYAFNLEENPIDEDFIIKTPKTDDNDEAGDYDEYDDLNIDIGNEISDNFDNVINAKIGGKPILAIVSSILGIILLIISVFIFQSRSDRVIDNVVSGESNFLSVIFLVVGLLLLIYGVYKLFNLKNPFENITNSIDTMELNNNDSTNDKKEKPSQKTIEKSKIPLDKDSYKIGEFNLSELKSTFKKPKVKEEKPPERKDLITKEIEEIEYEQAKLEGESIDDIFAELEDDELESSSKK